MEWGQPFEYWLIWPKLIYFFLNFTVYSSYHFSFKYLSSQWNVSLASYGLLSLLTLVSFFTSIISTTIADHSRKHTIIIVVCAVAYALSFNLLWLMEDRIGGTSSSFLFVSFCYLLVNIFISPLYPLVDNRVMVILENHKTSESISNDNSKNLYGRQRLWGAIGQSAVSVVSAKAINAYGFPGMFAVTSISSLIFVVLALIHFPIQSVNKGEATLAISSNISMSSLLISYKYLLFMIAVLLGGIARGVVGNYLQPFLELYLDIPIEQYANLTVSRLITEIASFFIGKPLLEIFGAELLLFMGIISGLVRIGFYGFMPLDNDLWIPLVPLVELLKGINSAFMIVGGTRIAHDIAPIGAEAVSQGFFHGVHGNLANSFSGLIGNIVCRVHDGNHLALRYLFQYSTLVAPFVVFGYSLVLFANCTRNFAKHE